MAPKEFSPDRLLAEIEKDSARLSRLSGEEIRYVIDALRERLLEETHIIQRSPGDVVLFPEMGAKNNEFPAITCTQSTAGVIKRMYPNMNLGHRMDIAILALMMENFDHTFSLEEISMETGYSILSLRPRFCDFNFKKALLRASLRIVNPKKDYRRLERI